MLNEMLPLDIAKSEITPRPCAPSITHHPSPVVHLSAITFLLSTATFCLPFYQVPVNITSNLVLSNFLKLPFSFVAVNAVLYAYTRLVQQS